MARSAHQPTAPGALAGAEGFSAGDIADVAVGASALAVSTAVGLTRRVGSALRPLARVALRPAFVPQDLRPARVLEAVARVGAEQRVSLGRELSRRLDVLVPLVLAEVLVRARLTEMLPQYVDLDDVVAAVDLDAAAARLDVDAVVGRADIGAVVERVDVDSVLDRVDLTAVVLRRVDLDAVLAAVLDRIDLTSVVLRRVNLDAVLAAVLDRIDLTAVVLERVDLGEVVDAALAEVDLVGLAEEVIDGVDLPGIIRESTGSMASDTVRGVRMQGIVADEAVGRAVDRLLLRRGRRATEAPSTLGGPADDQPAEPAIPAQSDRRR
jgi:hypothetical protein